MDLLVESETRLACLTSLSTSFKVLIQGMPPHFLSIGGREIVLHNLGDSRVTCVIPLKRKLFLFFT